MSWVTKRLHRGDLRALSKLARIGEMPLDGTIERLVRRGFMVWKIEDSPKVTLKGRLALLLRPHH